MCFLQPCLITFHFQFSIDSLNFSMTIMTSVDKDSFISSLLTWIYFINFKFLTSNCNVGYNFWQVFFIKLRKFPTLPNLLRDIPLLFCVSWYWGLKTGCSHWVTSPELFLFHFEIVSHKPHWFALGELELLPSASVSQRAMIIGLCQWDQWEF